MKKFVKIVHDSIGTFSSPSGDRQEFIENIQDYIKACEKMRVKIEIEKGLRLFFQKNEVALVVRFITHKDGPFYYINNVYIDTGGSKLLISVRDIYSIFSGSDILFYLQEKKGSDDFTIEIERDKVVDFCNSIFTSKELDLFNAVECYQKELLESTIENNNKKSAGFKI